MGKKQFQFDPVTQQFLPISRSWQSKLLHVGSILTFSIILAVFFRFATDKYFTHPKEIKLLSEKEALVDQYLSYEERILNLEENISRISSKDDQIYRAYYSMDPIAQSIREAGHGGSDRYKSLEGYETSKLMINLTERTDLAEIQLDIQDQSFTDLLLRAEEHSSLLRHKPSIQPISLQDFYWISSVYGYRTDPMSNRRTMHRGVDFAGMTGLNVYATGDGMVKYTQSSRRGFGKEIVIDHGFGYSTRYGHLSNILVEEGQNIRRGMVIGKLGNTGKSTGPHLHYEVRLNNRSVNPKHYFAEDLSPDEYLEIVSLADQVD